MSNQSKAFLLVNILISLVYGFIISVVLYLSRLTDVPELFYQLRLWLTISTMLLMWLFLLLQLGNTNKTEDLYDRSKTNVPDSEE